MRIASPEIYLVGKTVRQQPEIDRFLADFGFTWETDASSEGDYLTELFGRLCYLSFGGNQWRKFNSTYIENILLQAHGSVTEHVTWNFIFTGVSRSLTHELVRHRAGVAVSQLSQRYVDESQARYVVPEVIESDPDAYALWQDAVSVADMTYTLLTDKLITKLANEHPEYTKVMLRKKARESARAVLPNATETMIGLTANARALRHIMELRGSDGAEPEIRRLAVKLARLMKTEAPNLFHDVEVVTQDGMELVKVAHHKV